VKESTRRRKRRQAHERQWVEVVALGTGREVSKSEIARRAGCCRQTVYNILAKARGLGEGVAPVPGKPGPPSGTGRLVSQEWEEKVVDYRRENPGLGYHYCYHDFKRQGLHPPAAATIGRIWRRAGQLTSSARPPRAPTRWTPPRPQRPGHLQVDTKYLPGNRYEFTALDVYGRYAFARVSDDLTAESAQRYLRLMLKKLPFKVHRVQVDGGSEFKAEFDQLLTDLGLHRRQNDPYSPWQNGVVERFHRTVAEECYLALPGELADYSTEALNAALISYLEHYNNNRLHSSLGYRPPSELLATTGEPVYPRIPRRCPTNP
jgi:transposase InsO family protein